MGVAVTSTGNQAIDDGVFADEIVPLKITGPDGSVTSFTVDESPPRRGTTMERLEALPVLHPEIPEFSITAGNSSGTNDAAAAMVVMDSEIASSAGLNALGGVVRAWAAAGVEPKDTGLGGAVFAIGKVLDRTGLSAGDVASGRSTKLSHRFRSRHAVSSVSTRNW